MKKFKVFFVVIILSLFGSNLFAQTLTLNEATKIYEYSHVKEFTTDTKSRLDIFSEKFKGLNYSNVVKTDIDIKGESYFSKLILGTAMEIHYQVFIQFKEGKYKLTINKFAIKDQRYGAMPLENIGKSSQKKWIEYINQNLPDIIKNIENSDTW